MRTRAPVVSGVQALPVTPRLACVRPAASVHPEPGSNSSSLSYKYIPPTTKNLPGPVSRFKFFIIYGTVLKPSQIRCLYNISMNSCPAPFYKDDAPEPYSRTVSKSCPCVSKRVQIYNPFRHCQIKMKKTFSFLIHALKSISMNVARRPFFPNDLNRFGLQIYNHFPS